jgi:phosphonopyruvate decarboxylase
MEDLPHSRPDRLQAPAFLEALDRTGIDFVTGVPCSLLTDVIDLIVKRPACQHVGATHEGEALAIAAGAWLGGRTPAVYLQNSGLGNLVNPVTSLCAPFRVPVLLVVTWRGEPGLSDEPQHLMMGRIMRDQLDLLDIPHDVLPLLESELGHAVQSAQSAAARSGYPAALIVPKGSFATSGVTPAAPAPSRKMGRRHPGDETGPLPERIEALDLIRRTLPEDVALVATTGKTGRELFELGDTDRQFYLVGSMGYATAVGLGAALSTSCRIAVLDGDGAALMKLGNMATIGAASPDNLIHIVLDNGVHDSTGGQPTCSASVDFAAVAQGCGYRNVQTCQSLAGLEAALDMANTFPGPTLVHARIRSGSKQRLGRPTLAPDRVAARFRGFLASFPRPVEQEI